MRLLAAVRRAVLLLLAALALPALGADAAVAEDAVPVLGIASLMGQYGEGWGTVRPPRLSNGGVPSGVIAGLRWRRWGARAAVGRGRTSAYRPGGGYYDDPVPIRIRALRVRTCRGAPDRRAYTRMIVSQRVKPKGAWTAWAPWTLDLCDFDARPRSCRPVAFEPRGDHGAFDVTAWDVRCRVARRLARASRRVAIGSGSGGSGPTRYALRWHGFTCDGYALPEPSPVPQISWTCHRRMAQVTFKRS